jgi:Domain of unknown function (DUF4412)
MFKRFVSLSVVMLFLVVAVAGCVSPKAADEYSAESVMTFGGRTQKSKIYAGKNKWRMDFDAFGRKGSSIADLGKQKVWILMPAQKMYMEQKFSSDKMMGLKKELPGEIDRKKVGSEKINGVQCDKFVINYKQDGKTVKMYQWLSKDMIPMKSKAADGSWSTELKNIKIGKQPASLFKVPAGYKKFSMPKMPKLKF